MFVWFRGSEGLVCGGVWIVFASGRACGVRIVLSVYLQHIFLATLAFYVVIFLFHFEDYLEYSLVNIIC